MAELQLAAESLTQPRVTHSYGCTEEPQRPGPLSLPEQRHANVLCLKYVVLLSA